MQSVRIEQSCYSMLSIEPLVDVIYIFIHGVQQWDTILIADLKDFSDFGRKHNAINKILAEELATADLDLKTHSDDLLVLISD